MRCALLLLLIAGAIVVAQNPAPAPAPSPSPGPSPTPGPVSPAPSFLPTYGSHGSGGSGTNPWRDPYLPQVMLLSRPAFNGRVLLENRQPVLEPLVVKVSCPDETRTAFTDEKGRFVVVLREQAVPPNRPGALTLRFARCEFLLDAAGFEPIRKKLDHVSSLADLNLGALTLKPLTPVSLSFSRTTATQPPQARKQLFQALQLLATGHGDTARARLGTLAAAFPGFAAAHYHLGRLYDAVDRRDAARDAYRAAVRADPHYFLPLYQLVQMAVEDRQWPEAARLASQARALSSSHEGEMMLVEAGSLFNLGQLPEADKLALAGADREPRLHLLRGEIFSRYGNLPAALALFQRYLELAPESPDAEVVRIRIALLSKRPGT